MTKAETRWKRLIVRWTAPKGFVAIVLFFALTIVIQVLLVYSFQSFGLIDLNVWTETFLIPYSNLIFTISISPLFHILPLSIIVVLLSSWAYLTKSTAFIPHRAEPAKRISAPTRRGQEDRRFKSVRRVLKRLNRRLGRIGRFLKTRIQRTRGVSYVSQRLSFARTAVRSAATVFAVFISMVLLLFLIEYPDLIHNWILNLYQGSPSLRDFVLGVAQWMHGIGQAVPPLAGFGSAINDALIGIAPGFRNSIENAGAALTRPASQLDLVNKYILSQNVAAWISAILAILYATYASQRPSRRSRGR